ncbi:4-hydroxy-3-methylbut-2-en-1-yl diphosphate synthase [Candidatus Riesia sp. GBBU]|nr:4-hydroxy-3-methylbut-2-en-1-yl diphosphate synthase [Candidatus Riesia sp. GBBU]
MKINRRRSSRIYVGKVSVGGDSPISVQSMTNTPTSDIESTINQIKELEKAGVDIVRVSVPDSGSAESLKTIKDNINVPIVADIHFNYRIAIKSIENGADCLRINPGNIPKNRIKEIVSCAKEYNIPIRIGINGGSLEETLKNKYKFPTSELLVESSMRCIDLFDKLNFYKFKVSLKSSDVLVTVNAYRIISNKIDQPLHIGITESGGITAGSIKSSIGLGILLSEGIGDTLRVSLSANPVKEVKVGIEILKALSIRSYGINFISCPTCARQEFNVIKTLNSLEEKFKNISVPMTVAIIGCIVNGHGESKNSTIGLVGTKSKSILYEDGIKKKERICNSEIIKQLEKKIKDKIDEIMIKNLKIRRK